MYWKSRKGYFFIWKKPTRVGGKTEEACQGISCQKLEWNWVKIILWASLGKHVGFKNVRGEDRRKT